MLQMIGSSLVEYRGLLMWRENALETTRASLLAVHEGSGRDFRMSDVRIYGHTETPSCCLRHQLIVLRVSMRVRVDCNVTVYTCQYRKCVISQNDELAI